MSKIRLYKKVAKLFLQNKLVSSMDIGISYDVVSKNYDNCFLNTMHQYNDEMLRHLCRQIQNQENSRVLDLAAGTGYNSIYLLKYLQDSESQLFRRPSTEEDHQSEIEMMAYESKSPSNYSFTLVDLSNGMLQKANEKLGDRVQYIKSDMLSYLTKCKENQFDTIICSWAIKYQEPAKIIAQCQRVLKPGGYIAVIVNTKKTLPQVREIYPSLLEKFASKIDKLMLELPNPKSLSDFDSWYLNKDFKKIISREGSHDFKFDSSEKLTEFVTTTGALAGFDRMLDLRNEEIQKEMASLFKQKDLKTATHHFVYGIYQK